MRYLMILAMLFVCGEPNVKAQTTLIPAGTLLRCAMDEPNFSPKTVAVGDPTLCHLSQITEFGRAAFPRGSYLIGHLEAAKQPGHFFGKGYMKITFDRIGLPNLDSDVDAKIVSARDEKTDREGRILGHGHAKRDVAEWLFPPMWPWKVVMLPARGPQPRLKTEQQITLRLMEDVEVPRISEYSSAPSPWHYFGDPPANPTYSPQSYARPAREPYVRHSESQAPIAPHAFARVYYLPPSTPAGDPPAPATPVSSTTSQAIPSSQPDTFLVLKPNVIFQTKDYWIDGHLLWFVQPNGSATSASLNDVDWRSTIDLNAHQGIRIVLRTHPAAPQVKN